MKQSATMLGLMAGLAAAHGTVPSFSTDGEEHGGFLLDYYYMELNGQTPPATAGWYAENLDNGFVAPSEYGTDTIACHKNARPATSSASVAAGGTVDFQWSAWPESHIGPVLTYVAKCDGDCAEADKATLKWVKIDEAGIDLATQKWAATQLIEDGNVWTTTVPATLAPGNYVFRHEIIAMHGAGSADGAQNYPQCFNIEITGSGTENPEGVVASELYTADHPGILFNPYGTLSSYEIPGPALYTGGSGSGSPAPAPAPSATVAPTPTAVPSATSTPTAAPAPAETTAPAPPAEEEECPVLRRRRLRREARRAARMHARQFS
ncbi:hypothetical protein S7711_07253 [Stachybotrys chartarum IBT 7711]|uniref:lytic cellulose monooxygenase (C4-dehydrogenating) n=1 Tax=Stachybotrys chartarum (strain CBS 109288 / IBT 7711) TaxID=1280523 RepID=A0A084AS83_STACB|nr:hypothetical protein S7711_07253 [Stachybotrys chartarum IBT 7711]KFA52595.1 hypothetical protein S40293_07235 [Stachybotrys chartarum IBT 40293]